jgi:hypothetical protein
VLLGRFRGLRLRERVLLQCAVERDHEVVPVRRSVRCDFLVDEPGDDMRDQSGGQRLHVEERTLADGFGNVFRLVLADQLLDAAVRDHDLDRRHAAAADLRQQALGDDAAKHAGENRADLRLLHRGEELDVAADRLGRIDRVHRREHEVAGLGCLQRGLGGLRVAQLADQDHIRVLAQHAAERFVERIGVEPHFALVDDAVDVRVDDLDGVLDRDDVLLPRPVDVTEHRGERRRLAAAGSAGDEHEPAVLLRQPLHAGREAEAAEVRDLRRDDAEGKGDVTALPERVHAEPGQVGQLIGGVHLARLLEEADAAGRARADRVQDLFEGLRAEGIVSFEGREVAVDPNDRGLTEFEMDVAGAEVDGLGEDVVEAHSRPIGRQGRII